MKDEKVINFPKNSNKNKKKKPLVLYTVLVIGFIVILSKLFGGSSFESTNSVNTETIPLASANNFDFASYKDGYILAKDGKISCYNTNQNVQWEIKGSKTVPNVKVNGDYVLTYYDNDTLAVVTNGRKTVDISTPGSAQYGYVNTNGYCALLVDEFGLKNKIVVYNKKGEMIYYRDNPDKFIAQIILSNDNKSLVTVELVTSESSISSELVVTNIKTNNEETRVAFENTMPGGCIFTDTNSILTIFDTKLQCYGLNGRLRWETKFDGKTIYEYSYDNEILACVFNTDDSAGSGSEVAFYNKRGKNIGNFTANEKIRNIDLKNKNALLTYGKRLVLTNFKGKEITQADITYDMKDSLFMGTKKCALVISASQDAKLLPLK